MQQEKAHPLLLDAPTRTALWNALTEAIEARVSNPASSRVAPELDPERLRRGLEQIRPEDPTPPLDVLALVLDGLERAQVHTDHPMYFGLFNPAPPAMGIAADAVVAAWNPQLAAWSHSPFANEVERYLVEAFGRLAGYDECEGTFCSGGAEANHTAVVAALASRYPNFSHAGVRSLDAQPVLFASEHSHHSFIKAARFCGLGDAAVRSVPVDDQFRMRPDALREALMRDRRNGDEPFLIVTTAGTTASGAVDPLREVAEVAREEACWYHVDAAWGGAALILPEMKPHLSGIELADSITFDAHKWLSVPMGAGMFITRHRSALRRACGIDTSYMPKDGAGLNVTDPYVSSMQWSRRFTGLKLFMTLAAAGWEGYASVIRHQIDMAGRLAGRLREDGWDVVNDPRMAVVCFRDPEYHDDDETGYLQSIADAIVASGEAWISTTSLGPNRPVLRACITNYRTQAEHVDRLAELVRSRRRAAVSSGAGRG